MYDIAYKRKNVGSIGFKYFQENYAIDTNMRINAKTMGLERLFVLEYTIEYEDLFLCGSIGTNLFFPQNDDSLRNA